MAKEANPWTRLRAVGRALLGAGGNYFRDGGPDLSAAVAFYSLLSLPPLLYLSGAALAWVYGGKAATDTARTALDLILPPEVAAWLLGGDLDLGASGEFVLVALPALLWSANRGFASLGIALNVVFGVRRRRANWLARLKGLGLMVGWLGFLTLSIAAGTVIPQVNALLSRVGHPFLSRLLENITALVVAPAISFVTFVLFYRLLPYVRVAWRPALAGAVLAWLAWEAARRLFGDLLAGSQALGLVSGTVAGIITFLMWVYTTVAIVLLGAEFTAIQDGHRSATPAAPAAPASSR